MEQNNNTIIFTMARMNPPTPGHLELIKTLIDQALRVKVNKVFIILSKTNDNNDDPIPCAQNLEHPDFSFKTNIIESMVKKLKSDLISNIQINNGLSENNKNSIIQQINNIQVISRCVPIVPKQPNVRQPTPFTPLYTIINDYLKNVNNLNLFMIVGDDRKNLIDNIADNFYKKMDYIHSIDGIVMPREGMNDYKKLNVNQLSDLDMNTVPINAFSASFVRNLVKYGLKNKFDEIYKPYLTQEQMDKLYNTIQVGLNMKPSKKSSEKEANALKYNYPLVKNSDPSINTYTDNDIENIRKKRKYDSNGGKQSRKSRTRKYKRIKKSKKYNKIHKTIKRK